MSLLPQLKGLKVTKNILPSLQPLNRRAVWEESELQYDGTDPPKAWLARVKRLQQIHGYSDRKILKIINKCLKGNAQLWFRIYQPESFESLRTGLHTRFASGPVIPLVKPCGRPSCSLDPLSSISPPKSRMSQEHVEGFASDVPNSLPSGVVNPSRVSKHEDRDRLSSGRRTSVSNRSETQKRRTSNRGLPDLTSCPRGSPLALTSQKQGGHSAEVVPKLADNCLFFPSHFKVEKHNKLVEGCTCNGGDRFLSWSQSQKTGPKYFSDGLLVSSSACNVSRMQQRGTDSEEPGPVAKKVLSDIAGDRVIVATKLKFSKCTSEAGKSSRNDAAGRTFASKSSLGGFDSDTRGKLSLDKTARSMDTFSLSSLSHSISAKDILANNGVKTIPPSYKASLPVNGQDALLQFKRAIHSAMKGDWRLMSSDFCRFYLQCYGMRTSGSKNEQIHRIRDHLELTDGSGAHKYPRNSFIVDCSGNVCLGDVILFEQRLREGYNVLNGNVLDDIKRTTVGRVVKDSKSPALEQAFTIEVYWSKGPHAFRPMRPVCIKAMDLYTLRPIRQRWINEEARKGMIDEKKNSKLEIQASEKNKTKKSEV